VKPSNVLVDAAAGKAWLTGFGFTTPLPRGWDARRRNGIGRLFRLPGLTRRFASFPAAHADPVYLLPER